MSHDDRLGLEALRGKDRVADNAAVNNTFARIGIGLAIPNEMPIPRTVNEAVEKLDGFVSILNAAEWGVAAIVWAYVDESDTRGAHVKSDMKVSPTEFSELGIRGLASPNTVRKYRRAWQHAIDEGWAEPARPGEVARLPEVEFQSPPASRSDPIAIPPPEGQFSCIVIDPPWPMDKIERDVRPNQGPVLDYPVLTITEIADDDIVPVRSKAADDCHIYLWVTHRFLPDGIDLLAEWDFNYQCVMTWRKNVGITPYSWMYDTEHVLFGRRGNLPLDRLGLRLSFEAPVTRHSAKPDVFYQRVVEASPGPRLEMFARSKREGFTAWGNEVTPHG
jgi:N6-adenosine-specific RNA methylase IME4